MYFLDLTVLSVLFALTSTEKLVSNETFKITNETNEIETARILINQKLDHPDEILSRKKRYLVFPGGSSLQLVYCLTMPVLGQTTIYTIGGTAALAWELPSEPMDLKKHKKILANKKIDKVVYKNEKWDSNGAVNWDRKDKVKEYINYATYPSNEWSSNPIQASYKYKKFYNAPHYQNIYNLGNSPAYQQSLRRRVYYKSPQNGNQWQMSNERLSYNPSVNYQKPIRMNPIKSSSYSRPSTYLHPVYQEVHRRTRRDLYSKLEKFFSTQSIDGKACLLKAVCEVGRASEAKGGFMEEIIKAVFKAKPHDEHPDEDEYDTAFNKSHNCTELYPTCPITIWNFF